MTTLASVGGRVPPSQSLATILKNLLLGSANYTDVKLNGLKTYRALITQAGTAAPTAKALENTIGVIVLARGSQGTYTLTLSAAFTADKTFLSIGNLDGALTGTVEQAKIEWTSANVITITTADVQGTSLADALMTDTPVEILVYP
jgi:hypothetical protein